MSQHDAQQASTTLAVSIEDLQNSLHLADAFCILPRAAAFFHCNFMQHHATISCSAAYYDMK